MLTQHHITLTESGGGTEPVALAEAKSWLNIDFDDDDALLERMIKGARETIENYTNLKFVETNVEMLFETSTYYSFIQLPFEPLDGFTINTISETGISTPASEDTYYPVLGGLTLLDKNLFSISYTTKTTLTEALKEAILMEVAQRYANRGDNGEGLSKGAQEKAVPYQQIWL